MEVLAPRLPRRTRGSQEAERSLLHCHFSTSLLHCYFGCVTTGAGTTTAGGAAGVTVGSTGEGGIAGAVAVTVPLIFAFSFLPIVPRALRVAAAFWALATACSGVSVAFLGGVKPKSARTGLFWPKALITY